MTNLRDNVKAFHVAMEQYDPVRPTVPSDDIVRLRARLITEEYFETMRALFAPMTKEWTNILEAESHMASAIGSGELDVDLLQLADGLADLEYVCEGSFLACGIDSAPVHAEVQRSNMAKIGGPIREDGKRLKPQGWTPPDIEVVIKAQRT